MRAALLAVVAFAALVACNGVDADGPDVDAGVDDDPLIIPDEPAAGSLDDLHARIIKPRCSGTPGLCHNGQFEPNLATPSLAYEYLVGRPGLEKPDRLRVRAGDPSASLVIDKLRARNGVATQMPLGAEPLPEEDIAALEAWIAAGALRAPGAAPAPVLNNPPKRPEIGVYTPTGARLDGVGGASIAPGTSVVLRHTVQDFETADGDIAYAAILLINNADGRAVVLDTTAGDPAVGATTYDGGGPMGTGDLMNFQRPWTIGATLQLVDDAGARETVAAAGLELTPIAVYYDSVDADGIAAYTFSTRTIRIQ